MKIALLIPSTSNGMNWKTYDESFLYKLTLTSFLRTYDTEHEYTFYIGIDIGDNLYDQNTFQQEIKNVFDLYSNITIQFIHFENVLKGHLTIMWNQLFQIAYNEMNDYFYQCGDDIQFQTKGWINDCIDILQRNNNNGITGPINNNPRILTQTFVSRNHMIYFNYYFPPEIINWFCDDWINEIYKKINAYYPLLHHKCNNLGGDPRYVINNDAFFLDDINKKMLLLKNQCISLVNRDFNKIKFKIIYNNDLFQT